MFPPKFRLYLSFKEVSSLLPLSLPDLPRWKPPRPQNSKALYVCPSSGNCHSVQQHPKLSLCSWNIKCVWDEAPSVPLLCPSQLWQPVRSGPWCTVDEGTNASLQVAPSVRCYGSEPSPQAHSSPSRKFPWEMGWCPSTAWGKVKEVF